MTEEAENLIYRTDNAKLIMRKWAWTMDCRESECPSEVKMIMIVNHCESPWVLFKFLEKTISENETKIRDMRKKDKTIKYGFNAQAYSILMNERGKNCLSCTYHSDNSECNRMCFENHEEWKSLEDESVEKQQYCRYCGNCNQCDEDIIYCEQKEKTFSKEYACRLNKCKFYSCIGFDVFNPEKTYKPRDKKQNQDKNLMFNF